MEAGPPTGVHGRSESERLSAAAAAAAAVAAAAARAAKRGHQHDGVENAAAGIPLQPKRAHGPPLALLTAVMPADSQSVSHSHSHLAHSLSHGTSLPHHAVPLAARPTLQPVSRATGSSRSTVGVG